MFVPAANIVVSYDSEAMRDFQNTKDFGVFEKMIESKEQKSKQDLGDNYRRSTFLFSNSPNSTFMSLDHELGREGNKLILKIMDPQGAFEKEMLDADFGSQIDVNSDPFQQRIEMLEQEINASRSEIATLNRTIRENRYKRTEKAASNLREAYVQRTKVSDRLEALETQLENAGDLDTTDQIDVLKKQLKAYTGKMQRPVYITYGIGSNLLDWSPVQCYGKILKIKYQFSGEGIRQLVLEFAGLSIHPNLMMQGTNPLGITYNKGLLAKGISEFRLFNKEASEEAVLDFRERYKISDAVVNVEQKLGDPVRPSLHWPIVEATEDFIRRSTNYENVLVLLPDLDYWLRKYYEDEVDDVFWRTPAEGTNNFKDIADNIIGYGKVLEGLGYSLCETTGPETNISTAIGDNVYEYIEECNSIDKVDSWFTQNDYRVVLQTECLKKTVVEKLKEVGEAIESKINDFNEDEALVTNFMNQIEVETDFNLIQIMFEAGLITNPNKPVLIWGDRNFKEKILYASVLESSAKQIARDKEMVEETASFTESELLAVAEEKIDEYVNVLDQLRGISISYMKKVFDYFIPTSWVGPFGPMYNGANELDTSLPGDTNLQNAASKMIADNPLLASRLPLFSFGNKNPNILSVNFDLDGIFTAAMNSASPVGMAKFGNAAGIIIPKSFQDESNRVFEGMKNLDLNDVDPMTGVPKGFKKLMKPYYDRDYPSGDDLENFDQWQEIFNQLDASKYGDMSDQSFYTDRNWYGKKNGLDSEQKFLKFMWEAFSELSEQFITSPKMQQSSPSKNPSKQNMANSVRVNQIINSSALKGSIKTIPMFALSTSRRVMNKACVVHCVEPRIYHQNDPAEKQGSNTAWFSGVYNMHGFKHRITQSTAESTFYMSRPGNRGLDRPSDGE